LKKGRNVLAFEVEYLLGRVYAGDFRDRSEPEWPPDSSRLFSALSAAHFEGDRGSNERRALEWLERQGAPAIHAAQPGNPNKVIAFVPTNYPDDGIPELRGKQPRSFPAQAPADPLVHFIWPKAEPDAEIVRTLDTLASRVGYLGKSCSFVRMCVTERVPAANFVPDPAGDDVLRTVEAGRLANLEWRFKANLPPAAGAQQKYRNAQMEGAREQMAEGNFGEMLVFRRDSGVNLPIEAALTLTDAVRTALLRNAGRHGAIPDVISGHGAGDHCAITALPFTGGAHSDGRLMGFSIVMPRGIAVHERRRLMAAAAGLEEKGIHLSNPLGSWRVALDFSPAAQTLWPSTWTRPSKRWATVTPILLDRFPKRKGPTAEDILTAACVRAGIPQPKIIHGPYSPIPGVAAVPQFRLHRKKEDKPRWGVHAVLEFPIKVRGPILLGAGRYFGLGLLRPWAIRQEEESGDD
jgi:CRISPR-associated protein Csb2